LISVVNARRLPQSKASKSHSGRFWYYSKILD
jgi:hypothetical protein